MNNGDTLDPELEQMLTSYVGETFGRETGWTFRTVDFIELYTLKPFVTYEGEHVFVTRKCGDDFDLVIVMWKR